MICNDKKIEKNNRFARLWNNLIYMKKNAVLWGLKSKEFRKKRF